jgi:site-specific DNA recombinase
VKTRLQSVSKALAQTERQRERLLDAYLGGILELAEFERKRKELEARTDSLLAQKRQLDASARERTELARIADSIEEFREQVRAGLADANFEQKRRLVELRSAEGESPGTLRSQLQRAFRQRDMVRFT